MTLVVEKVNKMKVKPVVDRPANVEWRGDKILPKIVGVTFFAAKTESGKSTVIANLIPKIIGQETKCFLFVGTQSWDPVYEYIMQYFDENEIQYEIFDGVVTEEEDEETGQNVRVNNLESIIKELNKAGKGEPLKMGGKRYPRNLFLLDDVSSELKSKSVAKLFKQGRHFEAPIFVSSQDIIDIGKLVNQVQQILIWGGQSKERLEYIHRHMGLDGYIDFHIFEELYHIITSKPYNFMFVTRRGEIRANFDERVDVPAYIKARKNN